MRNLWTYAEVCQRVMREQNLKKNKIKCFIDFGWLMRNISERLKEIVEVVFAGHTWSICSSSADILIS